MSKSKGSFQPAKGIPMKKGWEKKIFQPQEPAFKPKVYDPKKGNTSINIPSFPAN